MIPAPGKPQDEASNHSGAGNVRVGASGCPPHRPSERHDEPATLVRGKFLLKVGNQNVLSGDVLLLELGQALAQRSHRLARPVHVALDVLGDAT